MRQAEIHRKTRETDIRLRLNIDGSGHADLQSGIPFFDHMLEQIARHGLCDLYLRAQGDLEVDGHHTVEDIGICLGQALAQSLGDKSGINRYGEALVPLDEALSQAVIDCSGRPGLFFRAAFKGSYLGQFDVELVAEFFRAVVNHAAITVHLENLRGDNTHHQVESLFKAFARALRKAVAQDARAAGVVPSTKGSL